jgi:hypothetical protein
MNVHFPVPHRSWPGRLAHLAVIIVVLALAAATFVLSYTGVHSIALQAGVTPRFARIYPGVFDAALIIACVAALMLRGAPWWARCYAWLCVIVVIVVVGGADVLHATNAALPHRGTAGVVAAAPWVLVLLGFSLWLTILRHSGTRSVAGEVLQPIPAPARAPGDADGASSQEEEPAAPPEAPAAEEEPPPPFAAMPRLRRVRSTPTPPEDDEDQ